MPSTCLGKRKKALIWLVEGVSNNLTHVSTILLQLLSQEAQYKFGDV
jgi:hypothetical protein